MVIKGVQMAKNGQKWSKYPVLIDYTGGKKDCFAPGNGIGGSIL